MKQLITAPFKGICDSCKKRLIVRNYPYNENERLGTLCTNCFKEINKELSEYKDFYEEDNY